MAGDGGAGKTGSLERWRLTLVHIGLPQGAFNRDRSPWGGPLVAVCICSPRATSPGMPHEHRRRGQEPAADEKGGLLRHPRAPWPESTEGALNGKGAPRESAGKDLVQEEKLNPVSPSFAVLGIRITNQRWAHPMQPTNQPEPSHDSRVCSLFPRSFLF